MNDLRQVLLGICAALISVVIIVGSFSLVITEAGMTVAVIPSPVSTQILSPGEITLTTMPETTAEIPGTPTPADFTALVALPNVQIALPTGTATEHVCDYPPDWIIITPISGDTFDSIAKVYQITTERLKEGNCLQATILIAGHDLHVPPLSTIPITPVQNPPTQPPGRCGPPSNWVIYRIRAGDTLFTIEKRTGVTVAELQNANCMGTTTLIRAGETLYVPFIPYILPSQTPQATRITLPTNTFEPPIQATDTATTQPVFTPIPTNTPPAIDTSTPLPPVPIIPSNTPPAPTTMQPSSTPLPTSSPTMADIRPKP